MLDDENIRAIITDFNHVGMNGYEFAKRVRVLEEQYKTNHIPIIILTMVNKEHSFVKEGMQNGYFNKYFSKGISKDELINYFQKIVL